MSGTYVLMQLRTVTAVQGLIIIPPNIMDSSLPYIDSSKVLILFHIMVSSLPHIEAPSFNLHAHKGKSGHFCPTYQLVPVVCWTCY